MNREVLCRPFSPDQIRTRPGRNGQQLSYVATPAVIERLNQGCDSWGFEITEHSVHDDEVIVLGRLTADGVVKSAFGGSSITVDQQGRIVSLADDLKAAASDALKKAATLLGVGLELYGAQRQPPEAHTPRPNGNGGDRNGQGNPDPGNRVTSRQLAALHAACRRLAVSRDDLIGIAQERFGVGKVELLSKGQASELLHHFNTAPGAHP